jgi:rhodanese-related sulfurtransferase
MQTGAVQVVDVRNDDEVARGVIAGSMHIQLNSLPMRIHELKPEIPIVFYCHSGVRSAHACAYMAEHGFTQLYNLRGGILAWNKTGFPLVSKI